MSNILAVHRDEVSAIYDEAAARMYDVLELDEKGAPAVSIAPIIDVLARQGASRILDMTCGTGAQCIELAASGFEVVASDASLAMIEVAKKKAYAAGVRVQFSCADMRSVSMGKFDAIISMYNAIGHLSQSDFARTIRNAAGHLVDGGSYVFDIFDRSKMGFLPRHEFIDRVCVVGDTKYVRFSQCLFCETDGTTTWRQRTYVQFGVGVPEVIEHKYTLQTYSSDELLGQLLANGFAEVDIVSGEESPMTSDIGKLLHFVVARKRAG